MRKQSILITQTYRLLFPWEITFRLLGQRFDY